MTREGVAVVRQQFAFDDAALIRRDRIGEVVRNVAHAR